MKIMSTLCMYAERRNQMESKGLGLTFRVGMGT